MNKTYLYIIYNAQQNFLYLFLGNTPSLILSCQTNRTLLAVHNVCCQCPSHSLKPLLICFFALVVLNCFVSNQHCFSIRSYLFSENAELFGKVMTSPGKFSSDETFMSTCTWNRLATPCPLTSGIQIYFSPPQDCDIFSEVLDVTDGTLQFLHQQYHTIHHVRVATDLSQVIGRQINHLMWMTLP